MKIYIWLSVLFLTSCGGISKIDYHNQINGVDINKTSLVIEEDVMLFSKDKKQHALFLKGIYYPYRAVNKSLYIWYASPNKVLYKDSSFLGKIMLNSKPKDVSGGFMISNGEVPRLVKVWLIDSQGNFSLKEDANDLTKVKYKLLLE